MIRLISLLTLLSPLMSRAHEGHGHHQASHWHATDGLIVVGVVLALWVWRRAKK